MQRIVSPEAIRERRMMNSSLYASGMVKVKQIVRTVRNAQVSKF